MAVDLELPRTNYLRPNGHGGYIIRQSDLSSWSRCQLQKFYNDRARNDPEAPQPETLSATVYGTVVHYALQVMETAMHEGREDALELGIKTFEHYWANTHELSGETITTWLPRQTYGGLRERGRITLRTHYDLLAKDESWLLALEYQFAVPLWIDERLHTVTGTIDRLAIKKYNRKPYLSIDDNKTGKQPTYLRYNTQGSIYAWASTLAEFWHGWDESGMGELSTFDNETVASLSDSLASHGYRLHEDSPDHRHPLAARRFRWINLQDIKFADGGWRNDRDYARAHLAIDAYVRACEAGIYAVNTTGEICRYCPFRKTCAGPGLPDELAGAP
jgi:hypothetical protein